MNRYGARYVNGHVIRGLVSVLGTAVYPLLSHVFPVSSVMNDAVPEWALQVVPVLFAALMIGGALLIDTVPVLSRIGLTFAFFGVCGTAVAAKGVAPMTVYVAVLLFSIVIIWVWYSRSAHVNEISTGSEFEPAVMETRAACVGAMLVWGLQVGLDLVKHLDCRLSLLGSFLLLLLVGHKLLRRTDPQSRIPKRLVFGITVGGIVLCALSWRRPAVSVTWLTAIPAVGLFALRHAKTRALQHKMSWVEDLFSEPYRLLFFSFLGTCLAGGFLLALPVSAASGTSLGIVNALFTSVSATCVTGLSVADTARDFSFFGQCIILLLIQIGGLGIMTFSAAAILLLGKRLSLRYEGTISAVIGETDLLFTVVRRMVGLTLATEFVGSIILFGLFRSAGDGWHHALFRGVFTAVSAYCNAGFALQSDSLMSYRHNTAVLHAVALLIIVGGIGPYVTACLPDWVRRKPVSLHCRIVLTTSLILLVVPAFFISILDWSNAFSDLSPWEKITNGWFQSVTTRTAGFNSVDIGSMHKVSITIMEGLMFVGGSPASTAGGIKTTTLAVLVLSVFATLRGRGRITVFGRRIAHRSVVKATAVVVVAAGAVFASLTAILLTQSIPFETALFEVISALGTVGLSVGGTGMLDEMGKGTVMLLMFAGRLGPLSLFLLLGADAGSEKWQLPEQEVFTG